MSSRKEEERNEKIIRGLMKLPPNRRCINCNNIGPQYVCTNFWTFICTACSGIHREFTHRVKSVSMAKFTSQEVEALQKGGNQRAREIYLKDWDLQRQRLPDSSNPERIRDFIRSVYLDRKYAGGKISDKPPRDSQSPRNHEDHRRASSYHSYSQSPPYEHQYEDRRYGKQAGMLTRKPGSDRGHYDGKISSFVYSPGRSLEKMYEDKFANDGSGSRASDYSVSSGGDTFRSGVQSPNFQKEVGYASPPVPTGRDVIAEDIRHQTLSTFPEANTKRDARVIPRPQRTSSSGSFGSSDGNSVSHKLVNSTTLADFILEPEQSTGTSQTPSGGMVYVDSFNSSVSTSPPTSSAAPIDLFADFTGQPSCVFHPTATSSSPPLDLFADIAQQPASVIHPSTMSSGRPIDLFSDPTTHPPSSIVQSPATGSGPPAELFADITHQPSTTTQPPAFPSPPGIDLFADISQKQSSTTHVEQKPSSVPFAESEGWATFDFPLHPTAAPEPKQQQPLPIVAPEGGISKGNLETHSNMNNSVQWSSVQNPTSQGPFPLVANQWHEIAHTAQPYAGPTSFQSWNAFDDPTSGVSHHSFENLSQTFEPQVSAQKSFVSDGHYLNSKNAEDLFKDGFQKSSTDDTVPGSSLLFSGVVPGSAFSQSIPSMGGMPSCDFDQKPTNPFDLPYDSELEPSIGFLNLTSLQAALADPSSSPAFLGDVSHQWFPQSPVQSYIPTVQQGGLAYMAGQTATPQLQNISSQGSVASLGGNPFA